MVSSRVFGNAPLVIAVVNVGPCDSDSSPSGHELLLVRGDQLARYSFPSLDPLGTLGDWPWEQDDDQIGSDVEYVSDDLAIMTSMNGPLFVIEVPRMRIVDEACVEGHGPRPVRELYRSLPNDEQLCTDLCYLQPCGRGRFVSVHRKLPELTRGAWSDHLISWDVGLDAPCSDGFSRENLRDANAGDLPSDASPVIDKANDLIGADSSSEEQKRVRAYASVLYGPPPTPRGLTRRSARLALPTPVDRDLSPKRASQKERQRHLRGDDASARGDRDRRARA